MSLYLAGRAVGWKHQCLTCSWRAWGCLHDGVGAVTPPGGGRARRCHGPY